MDFEAAERRLAQDQSNFRSRQRQTRKALGISAKAKREAELRRKKDAERKAARELRRKRLDGAERYLNSIDRSLGVVRSLGGGASSPAAIAVEADGGVGESSSSSSWSSRKGLLLRPTSIHGDGDKVALPPSVLESLASRDGGTVMGRGPLSFRIGILDPTYSFPASDALKEYMERIGSDDDEDDGEADMDDDDEDADDDVNDDAVPRRTKAYLDELSHRYLSYTHAAVVEFTQEEGNIGLPKLVSDALLDPKRRRRGRATGSEESTAIPATRTVDPATTGASSDRKVRGVDDEDDAMDVDDEGSDGAAAAATRPPEHNDNDDEEERTPGHLAWGAFDVPDADVEVTLISLPKGRKCTLVPTQEAVKHGFHGLKDVKLVLEQSLVRTRATLSVGDTVRAWHRGTKFDLRVSSVSPSDFGAVSCIDTDIEVDIGPSAEGGAADAADVDGSSADGRAKGPKKPSEESVSAFAPGVGRTLADDAAAAATTMPPARSKSTTTTTTIKPTSVVLPPEPPAGLAEHVCDVRVRGDDGSTGRRRFDVRTAKMRDLFAFARASVVDGEGSGRRFRLVTRFPRRVFDLDGEDGEDGDDADVSLADAGIGPGQELFMVERT